MSYNKNDVNMSEDKQHPAPDLQRALIPPTCWFTHLQDPNIAAYSNDIALVKNILAHGTEDYKKLAELYESGLARSRSAEQAYLEEKAKAEHHYKGMYEEAMRASAPLAIRSGPRPPEFSDQCKREKHGLRCDNNKCKYVHNDQLEVHAGLIALLKYPTAAAKSAAEAGEKEMGEEMEM
ncbi:hypothetical protein CC86DRAFT_465833 [Ophiobolus disseminans]|uniref:C3H1-type domain-containing protein n=1 Tax=Ophiobolus disseminans TaxID=1469910 RepID=A0A6A7A5P0_9PLEO|nr:hypothetical protein CC86DRAFT_465833 [Ophiobolus disseminans]